MRDERHDDREADQENEELRHVGDGDGPEPASARVEQHNRRREHDRPRRVHVEDQAEGRAERGEDCRGPEHFAGERGQVEQRRGLLAEALLERIEQRREAVAAHHGREPEPADDQAERVAPRRLQMQQPGAVGLLGGAVHVPAVDPGRGHGADAEAEAQAPAREHHVAEAAFLACVDAHTPSQYVPA